MKNQRNLQSPITNRKITKSTSWLVLRSWLGYTLVGPISIESSLQRPCRLAQDRPLLRSVLVVHSNPRRIARFDGIPRFLRSTFRFERFRCLSSRCPAIDCRLLSPSADLFHRLPQPATIERRTSESSITNRPHAVLPFVRSSFASARIDPENKKKPSFYETETFESLFRNF